MPKKRVCKIDYEIKKIYGGNERIVKPGNNKKFVKVDDTFWAFGKRYMAIHDMGKGCKVCCFYRRCGKFKKFFGSCMKSERPDHLGVTFIEIGRDR